MNRDGIKNDKAINHKAANFLLCHSSFMFRRQSSVRINFSTWGGNWRNYEIKHWISIKMFWFFHFPCFDISAVHVLIGDLTSSSCKLISKAEREKEKKKIKWEKPPKPHWSISQMESKTNMWNVAQSWLTLCDPMDYTVYGILQARILEWVDFPFSRGSSQPRDWTQVTHVANGFFTNWAIREALK